MMFHVYIATRNQPQAVGPTEYTENQDSLQCAPWAILLGRDALKCPVAT